MKYTIERINEFNYPFFDDMLFWRETGKERYHTDNPTPSQVINELANPNLYVYAAAIDNRFVGWISLVYIPKISRWKKGHIYVDEIWVAPEYRRQGIAKSLMQKADELRTQLSATGIRLYVNIQNPDAKKLYEKCGFKEDGQALFMEK